MSAATETELTLLPPQETALQVYTAPNGLDPFIAHIRAQIDEFNSNLPDLSTLKNRQLYASMAHKVAKSKTALDAIGKTLSADAKLLPKKIDAERKRCWDLLETWQVEVRKPLDDWQAAEDARVDAHEAGLDHLRNTNTEGASAAMIKVLIQDLEEEQIGDDWQEFEADAHRVKAASLVTLRAALQAQEKYEAEQAELIELRRQQAERDAQDERDRIAREAAERATREAEAKAQAERDAAAKREQELIDQAAQQQRQAEQEKRDAAAAAEQARLNAELAEQRRIAAEKQAELDRIEADKRAERERLEAIERQAKAVEQARLDEVERQQRAADEAERQAKAREDDKAHKARINCAALDAFVAGGMTEECAKQAVILIASRKIPSVSITY